MKMASASSLPPANQRQDLKSLLECSICLETFEEPRTLPCLHSFCTKCLENFVAGKSDDELNCPVCRSKFVLNKEEGVAGMTKNHFICNMVEVLSIQQQDKSIPCSHCQQLSAGRCVTCELFMCEKCLKFHNDYPGFKGHIVLTMEELSKPENQSKIKGKSYCKKHHKKKLKLYCETCEELICTYCMSFEHVRPDHECSPLEEVAERKREELKEECENLQRTVAEKHDEIYGLKENIESLKGNFVKMQHLVNEEKEQLLAELHDIVNIKANSIIEDARQVLAKNTKVLEERVQQKETFVNRVKASTDMARSLMENGNDEEIVGSYQSVVNHQIEGNFDGDELSEFDSSQTFEPILVGVIKELVENKAKVDEDKSAEKEEHWYSTTDGKLQLELLKVYFQLNGYMSDTSIDVYTQEIRLTLNGGYFLEFLANFPKEMPVIYSPDGFRHDDIPPKLYVAFEEGGCKAVVNEVIQFMQIHPYQINPGPVLTRFNTKRGRRPRRF